MEDSGLPRGRPRDPRTTRSIQRTALKLAYSGGIGNATVERIAAESGIAKSTIYRRWSNAASIVMDGFLDELGPLVGYDEEGSIERTLKRNLKHLVDALRGRRGELLRHLIGAAQTDPELRQAFLRQLIVPRREAARAAFARAVARGELRVGTNAEVVLDLLYGAIYYRLFVSFRAFDARFVDQIVARVFDGLSVAPRPRGAAARP